MAGVEVPAISRSLKKLGVTVRATQSPWMATLGDVTREKTYCFKLKKRVESKRALFTASLRNINQFNVTRLKGYPNEGGTCETISCVYYLPEV